MKSYSWSGERERGPADWEGMTTASRAIASAQLVRCGEAAILTDGAWLGRGWTLSVVL